MQECGADALDNKVEFGVWGGMTERQRRALLKQHPEVVSWADFFDKRRTAASADPAVRPDGPRLLAQGPLGGARAASSPAEVI